MQLQVGQRCIIVHTREHPDYHTYPIGEVVVITRIVSPFLYRIKTKNGELAIYKARLQPISEPTQSTVQERVLAKIKFLDSSWEEQQRIKKGKQQCV